MEFSIRLSDGRLVGQPDFSVRNGTLPFSAQRRRDCALAYDLCPPSQGYTLVLVKNGRLLAQMFNVREMSKACAIAGGELAAYYRRRRWPLPDTGVVAAMRPFPDRGFQQLASCGVDTIFAPERLRRAAPRSEESYIDEWLGRRPGRPDGEYRRIFVVEPYIAA